MAKGVRELGPGEGIWAELGHGAETTAPWVSFWGRGETWWKTEKYFPLRSLAGRGVLEKGTSAHVTKPSCDPMLLPEKRMRQSCQVVRSPSQILQQGPDASGGPFRGYGPLRSGGLCAGLRSLAACSPGKRAFRTLILEFQKAVGFSHAQRPRES